MKGMKISDFDADEPVAPLNPAPAPRPATKRTDRILGGTGILIAAAAAMFPWYVFFNEEKFGIRIAGWEQLENLPADSAARRPFSSSPISTPKTGNEMPPEVVDRVVTATISKLGETKDGAPPLEEIQPMPGRAGFRLLHVSNGRAMIEDTSGMYMVQVGSILPDNSRVATVEQRGGKWVIVTSGGELYSEP